MPSMYINRIVGALLGIAAALLILFIGFWKTLLIIILAYFGWWVTGSRKLPQPVIELLKKVLHLH